MAPEAREKPSRQKHGKRDNLPRYDQALRNAKNDGKHVKFQLSDETYFTEDDCTVVGTVNEVDKFDICIATDPSGVISPIVVWIKKSHIVATQVLA